MAARGARTKEKILAKAEAMVLRNGFSGTSLDGILTATGLTKGAFFHHFESKADFAAALVERYRRNHRTLFESFAAEADASSIDPLTAMTVFLERFEAFIESLKSPLSGCVFAAAIYQDGGFDPAFRSALAANLKHWQDIYTRRFRVILNHYRPTANVEAEELAEMIVSIIEGGLILSRGLGDAHLVARQSRQFRRYLDLLFEGREPR
jgi:TetR/AcrR family transcriptional repressor of nem operon